jgi:hypothetical protein
MATLAAHGPFHSVYPSHSQHFLQQFYDNETRERTTNEARAKQLTATQRLALRKELESREFTQPRHAFLTKVNIAGLLGKWMR